MDGVRSMDWNFLGYYSWFWIVWLWLIVVLPPESMIKLSLLGMLLGMLDMRFCMLVQSGGIQSLIVEVVWS